MTDPIVIVSTGGMVADWIGVCLSSAVRQTRRPDRHIVWTPDAAALDIARRYLARFPDYPIEFREDAGCALANMVPAFHEMTPETIVVCLDADDWFARDDALEIVARTYADHPDCFSTAGSFRFWPGDANGFAAPYPPEVAAARAWRRHDWLWTHLKTFRVGAAQRIRVEDLKRPDGEWIRDGADLALMFPILEMADGRVQFIPETLYTYNVSGDACVQNADAERLAAVSADTARIRALPAYERAEVRTF